MQAYRTNEGTIELNTGSDIIVVRKTKNSGDKYKYITVTTDLDGKLIHFQPNSDLAQAGKCGALWLECRKPYCPTNPQTIYARTVEQGREYKAAQDDNPDDYEFKVQRSRRLQRRVCFSRLKNIVHTLEIADA